MVDSSRGMANTFLGEINVPKLRISLCARTKNMKKNIVAENSAWDSANIESYLSNAYIPCRLSCITRDGFPHVTSLWFKYQADKLWFSFQQSSKLALWLAEEPRCSFEIAGNSPPYRGVRGRGWAWLLESSEKPVLESLIKRYLGTDASPLARWLLSRPNTELTLAVSPLWVTSWDYRKRMDNSTCTTGQE